MTGQFQVVINDRINQVTDGGAVIKCDAAVPVNPVCAGLSPFLADIEHIYDINAKRCDLRRDGIKNVWAWRERSAMIFVTTSLLPVATLIYRPAGRPRRPFNKKERGEPHSLPKNF
jgi:hypothetical protein